MKLNYLIKFKNIKKNKYPILLIHGLFGNLSNLTLLADKLSKYYTILQIDLRNHGLSPHSPNMNYENMSNDILLLLDNLSIDQCILIGHSMGGKVVMTLCALAPERIVKVIILDISPIPYNINSFSKIFFALEQVILLKTRDRTQAIQIMKKYISNENIILFLLKSFYQGHWKFNLTAIKNNYKFIADWQINFICSKPALFISGNLSSYIHDNDHQIIIKYFPNSYIHKIDNAGHWLHVEKPKEVQSLIDNFLLYF